MSAITNNIAWHANKSTPSVSQGDVVLASFSIGLRGRYEDAVQPTPTDRVLKGISVGIRPRYEDAEQAAKNNVIFRSMSAGYIGYPYQGSSQSYTPPPGSYDLIHHK